MKNVDEEIYEEIYEDENLDSFPIDTSIFKPMGASDIIRILEPTIKQDNTNKFLVFAAMLNAYTEENQMNIAFIAPSSSGKSHIPHEVSMLFPKEDIIMLGSASPTAFYHDMGAYDKETNTLTVDLERKIVIFLDQPNTALLERLRALLSHDEKEVKNKITDKSEKKGMRTKNVILRGFSTFVFCTAGLKVDEQESTRFLLLSPEINQEKIREAVLQRIRKGSDSESFYKILNSDPERKLLKQRILAIKQAHIIDIKIHNPNLVEEMFFQRQKKLKPRDQRDIAKIMNIIKSFALINYWFREKDGLSIVANDEDIKNAFEIWDSLSDAQSLGLPPYIYDLYNDVIVAEFHKVNDKNIGVPVGLTRGRISSTHYEVYGRYIADWQLRQIITMLETAGLIYQEADEIDKRKMLVYPTFAKKESRSNNSEVIGGVLADLDNPEGLLDIFDGNLPDLDI